MLTHISLKNFALIDKLEIEFFEQFNTLTGETGAGKSILIDAVGLCIGGRASASYIRSGSDKCTIIATFDVEGINTIKDLLEGFGLDYDRDLIVEREISRNGRNICRINSKITPLRNLREIGEHLVNIYGQHEHTQLLKESYQLHLIDQWGGSYIENLKNEIKATLEKLHLVKDELDNIGKDQALMARELDMLNFQIEEIEDANLVNGELEELEKESQFLANAENIFSVLNTLDNLLTGDHEAKSAMEQLGDIAGELESVVKHDLELKPIVDMSNSIYYDMQELDNINRNYQQKFDFDPARSRMIDERLNIIHNLRKKYGKTIEDIKDYLLQAHKRVNILKNSEEERARLKKNIKILEEKYYEKAKLLSDFRQEKAIDFTNSIIEGIKDLGMEHAKLKIDILFDQNHIAFNGSDQIRMYFSANKGEPLQILSDVISGGELSRLMLEIKTQFSKQNENSTIIFDEIDVGIGGKVAGAVAKKIAKLGESRQVLCVTHLPVIAAKAKHHYLVTKSYVKERTITVIDKVEQEKRIEEMMRMLGSFDEITRSQAKQMLDFN